MAKDLMTFEQVDEHMKNVDLQAIGEKSETRKIIAAASARPDLAISEICRIYKTVRPYLVLATQFPFLPKKWRDVIDNFVQTLDLLCP